MRLLIRGVVLLTVITTITACSTYSSYQEKKKKEQYVTLNRPMPKSTKILLLTGLGTDIAVTNKTNWWQDREMQRYAPPTFDIESSISAQLVKTLRSDGYKLVSPVVLGPNKLLSSGDVFAENYTDIHSQNPNNTQKATLYPETIYYLKQIAQDYDADAIILLKSRFRYKYTKKAPTQIVCDQKQGIASISSAINVLLIDVRTMKILAWHDGMFNAPLHTSGLCNNIYGATDQDMMTIMQQNYLGISAAFDTTLQAVLHNTKMTAPPEQKVCFPGFRVN